MYHIAAQTHDNTSSQQVLNLLEQNGLSYYKYQDTRWSIITEYNNIDWSLIFKEVLIHEYPHNAEN